jgi:hypothetical protein
MKPRPPEDYFPCKIGDASAWGPWIEHNGGERPSYVRTGFGGDGPQDVAIYVTSWGGGWGRNWSPTWEDIEWFRLRSDHPYYRREAEASTLLGALSFAA